LAAHEQASLEQVLALFGQGARPGETQEPEPKPGTRRKAPRTSLGNRWSSPASGGA